MVNKKVVDRRVNKIVYLKKAFLIKRIWMLLEQEPRARSRSKGKKENHT